MLTHLDGLLARNEHAQTGWGTQALLARSKHNIQAPIIEPDLFAGHRAHRVCDHLSESQSSSAPTRWTQPNLSATHSPESLGRRASQRPRCPARPRAHLPRRALFSAHAHAHAGPSGRAHAPVDVSTCVNVTALYCFALSAASTSAGSTAAPNGAWSVSTFAPYVRRLTRGEGRDGAADRRELPPRKVRGRADVRGKRGRKRGLTSRRSCRQSTRCSAPARSPRARPGSPRPAHASQDAIGSGSI